MNLIKLLDGVEILKKDNLVGVDISNISINSNNYCEKSLFICLKGVNYDGHDFVKMAEKNGAVAVVCEKDIDTLLPKVLVSDTRLAYARICANFYGNPEKELKIIGVTGTNGKTTTAFMISHILNSYGIKTGLIGTLGAFYDGKCIEVGLTTPDPSVLYNVLSEMRTSGVEAVVMEVSAHACELKKVEPIEFFAGVFTNLTQDHLDFFKDMSTYKNAKLKFLNNNRCKYLIVNSDDDVGRELSLKSKKVLSYGIDNPADVFAINLHENKSGEEYVVNLFDDVIQVKTALYGRFNVYNAMSAMLTSCIMGVPTYFAVEAMESFTPVNGRLEKIYDKEFMVFVDYAHTPDGLEKSLSAIKEMSTGRVVCLFGCGGNRDKDKRSKMGRISAKLADFTIITSDNPRFEEPMAIIKEIEKGVKELDGKSVSIENRRTAIQYALSVLKEGDVLLIAGKGAEETQEILGTKQPFNDKDVVLEVLENNG